MPTYATKDVTTRDRHAGSLYRPQYTMSAASEEPAEHQRRLISIPGGTRATVLTYQIIPVLDFSGGQGAITAANYTTNVSSSTVTASTRLAQLNPSEYLDSGNSTISRLGLRNVLWSNESSAASSSRPPQSPARSVLITDEVLAFCSQRKIFPHFKQALQLAQQSFSDLRNITVKTENDPESDDEWLLIVVQVHGEISNVLEMYDAYTRGLVRAVPWPARDNIRLIYDFI